MQRECQPGKKFQASKKAEYPALFLKQIFSAARRSAAKRDTLY